ncbi:MAG: alpha/beta hydrolase [Patescibacteria group bacterium]
MFSQSRKFKNSKGLTLDAIYKLAQNIKAPTLIAHGSEDTDIPLGQSQRLLQSLGGEKELSIIHGGVHQMREPTMQDAHTQLAEFFRNKLL